METFHKVSDWDHPTVFMFGNFGILWKLFTFIFVVFGIKPKIGRQQSTKQHPMVQIILPQPPE
jgi:hypothetical protein